MPMHRIYSEQGLYTPSEKSALAKAITDFYNGLFPKFYVVVLFIDIPKDSFFVGGEPNGKFVRFNIQHIARHFNREGKIEVMKQYEAAIKPFTADKGVDWEVNIDEADTVTWHENGMSPPIPDSAAEQIWKEKNKAVPFEGPSFSDVDIFGNL